MKHRYNPLVYVAVFSGLSLVSFIILYFFPDYVEQFSKGRGRGLDDLLYAVPVAFTLIVVMDNLSRSIETQSEYVKFNNFRFNSFNKLKTFSVTLSYESITGLDSKKLPLIGIYKILVISKNYPDPIPVSTLFLKHKQLFYTICTQAQRYNGEVLIDDDLLEFAEKHREKYD